MDLAVEIALWLNRLLPRRALERRASEAAYATWEYETGRDLFLRHFGTAERLAGATVLDAACGPGGKTAWYAEAAARTLGVDLDPAHLRAARRFGEQRGVGARQWFVAADVARLPLRDASVDLVTANDAMEHFGDPGRALHELTRVARRGGRLFVTFPPFHSPNGAHLYDYVRLPWCQNLLTRPALARLVERAVLEAEGSRGGGDTQARARAIAREQIDFFEHALNGLTVGRFFELVRAEPGLRARIIHCVPPRLAWLEPLTSLPGLREVATALVVAELERV